MDGGSAVVDEASASAAASGFVHSGSGLGIDQPAGKGAAAAAAAAAPKLLHRQGGAFVPFNRDRQLASPPFSPPTPAAARVVPDAASLSLSTTTSTVPTTTTAATNNGGDSEENTRVRDSSDARVPVEYAAQTCAAAAQPQRKARRSENGLPWLDC